MITLAPCQPCTLHQSQQGRQILCPAQNMTLKTADIQSIERDARRYASDCRNLDESSSRETSRLVIRFTLTKIWLQLASCHGYKGLSGQVSNGSHSPRPHRGH